MDPPPIGLIAGQGTLPLLEARGIRAAGHRVMCVALAGQFDPALRGECDALRAAGVVQLGKWIRLLRRWQVTEAVMAGGVRKARIYEPMRLFRQVPDWRAARLWYRVLRADRRDQTVLDAVAAELAANGIHLVDSTRYIPDHLATDGVMTGRQPSAAQWKDMAFAWPILHRLNELDVGQSLAVKDCDVIAVEAIEGTDAMIQRAGALCRSGGWTLVKGPHPEKDMRFDVPTVGPKTLEAMKAAGGKVLLVAAEKVILLDKPNLLSLADKLGIAIVGVPIDQIPAPPSP